MEMQGEPDRPGVGMVWWSFPPTKQIPRFWPPGPTSRLPVHTRLTKSCPKSTQWAVTVSHTHTHKRKRHPNPNLCEPEPKLPLTIARREVSVHERTLEEEISLEQTLFLWVGPSVLQSSLLQGKSAHETFGALE